MRGWTWNLGLTSAGGMSLWLTGMASALYACYINGGTTRYFHPNKRIKLMGCSAYFKGQWFQLEWTPEWSSSIMAKELVPILLSCGVWGPDLSRKSVCFQCDNSGVEAALSKGSAKEYNVMQLLRCLWFYVAHYDNYLHCSQSHPRDS